MPYIVVIGFFKSPEGGLFWQVLANRFLAVFAIWATTILAIRQLQRERELNLERLMALQTNKEIELQEEKIKVLKATMRTVLDIFGNFLNGMQYLKIKIANNKTLTPDELCQFDAMILDTASHLEQLANLKTLKEKKLVDGQDGIDYEPEKSTKQAANMTDQDGAYGKKCEK